MIPPMSKFNRLQNRIAILLVPIVLLLASSFTGLANAEAAAVAAPVLPLAPAFTLLGVDGKTHDLAGYRGQPVALFFFCGCVYCHRCAGAWSEVQRSGTLAQMAGNSTPNATAASPRTKVAAALLTLVLFHGEAAEARDFATATRLDPKQTVLLLDPDEKISALYKADPCPRVFVLDAAGRMRYTNDENGPESYKIPAPLIVARTVDALRAVTSQPRKTTTAVKGQKQ